MLAGRRHVVFDLDGTLTVAAHDFPAIKRTLGLPLDSPILESLAQLDAEVREAKRRELDAIEAKIAGASRPAVGAAKLLAGLRAAACPIGVVTRNTRDNAITTLTAAGLDGFVACDDIVGRDEAPAKPEPAGILSLLARWRARADDAVMIGDYLFDIQAGRAAGVFTILVCEGPTPAWGLQAHRHVSSLRELIVSA